MASYVMWSDALDSWYLFLSHPPITIAYHISIILTILSYYHLSLQVLTDLLHEHANSNTAIDNNDMRIHYMDLILLCTVKSKFYPICRIRDIESVDTVCVSLSYTVGILFNVECCIRQLGRSSTITSKAYNHHTDIYLLLNTYLPAGWEPRTLCSLFQAFSDSLCMHSQG